MFYEALCCVNQSLQVIKVSFVLRVAETLETIREVADCFNQEVSVRESRFGDAVVLESNSIADSDCLCFSVEALVCTVMVHRRFKVEAVIGVHVPRFPVGRLVVDLDMAPQGFERAAVVVEGAKEVCIS